MDATLSHRSLEEFWPLAIAAMSGKHRNIGPGLCAQNINGTTANTSFNKTRERRTHYGHFGHRTGTGANYCCKGEMPLAHDPGRLQYQLSDDSGFSSSSSSASSVADDFEKPPRHTLSVSQTPAWSSHSSTWSTSSSVCGAQSGTVASVLAAAVSDSEETDHCESDEETDNSFRTHGTNSDGSQYCELLNKQSLSHLNTQSSKSEEKFHLHHLGRDILDLGSNLKTGFPLKATALPECNLPLFLQNRSQYHRLGKFGTIERLAFATCKKQCGFAFPVPPEEAKGSCAVTRGRLCQPKNLGAF